MKSFVIFAAGALVGSAVTYIVTKDKYEKIANAEIESVKEAFSTLEEKPEEEEDSTYEVDEQELKEYSSLTKNLYPTDTISYNNEMVRQIVEEEAHPLPYVISKGDFCENMEYESETLVYYGDGVLADDFFEIVKDIDELVGKANLAQLGEGDNDSDVIYIRNEKMEMDYEILFDVRTYDKARQESLWLEES